RAAAVRPGLGPSALGPGRVSRVRLRHSARERDAGAQPPGERQVDRRGRHADRERQRPGARRLDSGRPVRRNPAIFGECPQHADGVQRTGAGRRQPAAQQSHALSRPYVSDRPAGRLPGPAVTSRARTKIMAITPFIGEVVMQAFNGNADSGAAAVPPTNNSFANNNFAVPAGGGSTPVNRYSNAAPTGTLLPAAITNTGGSQPHENRQPYTVISFCIALQGVF